MGTPRADGDSPAVTVGPLVVAKLGDAVTTVVGLAFVPGLVETNPAVRLAIHHAGVLLGVAVGTVLSVVVVVAVAEAGSAAVRRLAEDDWAPPLVRAVGYYPPAVVFCAAAANNAALIARVAA